MTASTAAKEPEMIRATTSEWGRRLALAGIVGVSTAAVGIAALDVWTLDWPRNPLVRTISEYALGPMAWPFYIAVLLVAAGSAAILAALVLAGLTRVGSGPGIGMLLWVIGMTCVVVFRKHDWTVGPSPSGYVHQLASLVAFISLPIAGLRLAKAWRGTDGWTAFARWTRRFAIAALLWFPLIVAAVLISVATSLEWWQLIPLGLTERLLTIGEIGTVLMLGRWGLAAHRPAPADVGGDVVG